MTHRLFVALRPPLEAIEHLAEFLAVRREADERLRWADPHQWHLTLAFMPTVPDPAVERLGEGLAGAAARHTVAPLALRGAGAFPAPERARVLWCGVTGDVDGMADLARSVRMTAAHEGASPEGGPFRAHVTLARCRPLEATHWLRVLETYDGPWWQPAEVELVSSHLGQGRGRRPRYETMAVLPLG